MKEMKLHWKISPVFNCGVSSIIMPERNSRKGTPGERKGREEARFNRGGYGVGQAVVIVGILK
ncbi:MAG: hypothetical protein IPM61_14700 [Chlorobi bacterium]|nr:hypothetical protein [Chlorobiota bacterium]MBX7216372.1 hypothetical protein [Candidatus Kapabacteria bacterium]